MTILSKISEFLGVIVNIHALYGVIIGLFVYKGIDLRKKIHLKRILSFPGNTKKCFVSIAKFKGAFSGSSGKEEDVVLFNELKSLIEVNNLLAKAGITLETNLEESNDSCNEIQIGGPASNEHTNRYVNYYTKNFKWITTAEKIKFNSLNSNLKNYDYGFVDISEDGKIGFLIGNKFYEYTSKKDWAILIKIIDKSDTPYRAIHLLFGGGPRGTIGAVNYFTHHYSSIYRSNKSKPYFGIFAVNKKCDRVGPITWIKPSEVFINTNIK